MGGGAPEVQGDWLRGVLLHDRGGGPGPVAEEDRRPHNQHRPRQPRETRAGRESRNYSLVGQFDMLPRSVLSALIMPLKVFRILSSQITKLNIMHAESGRDNMKLTFCSPTQYLSN